MKFSTSMFRTTLLASVLASGLASNAASAAASFTVNEGSITGALAQTVTADRLNFDYQAQIVQTVVGGSLAGAGDTFVETGFLSKGGFANASGSVSSQLNANVLGFGYGLYATFQITGEADPLAGTNGISATFQTMTMTLYVDPSQDTQLSLTSPIVGNSDDVALINYTLQTGDAHIFGGLANGDFDTMLHATLTAAGSAYFVGPSPFYDIENFGGNTQTFDIISGTVNSGFTARVNGGGLELFVSSVPEPSTYVMLIVGLGLLLVAAPRKDKHF